jgi:hypothetical protein
MRTVAGYAPALYTSELAVYLMQLHTARATSTSAKRNSLKRFRVL